MTSLPRSFLISVAALAMSLGVVGAISIQAFPSTSSTETSSSPAPPRADGKASALASSSLDQFVSRPLFLARRRAVAARAPIVAVEVAIPEPVKEIPRLSGLLTGVILSNERRAALIRVDDANAVSISEGESLGSWTLSEVSPDHVTFRLGTNTQILHFVTHGAEPSSMGSVVRPPIRRR